MMSPLFCFFFLVFIPLASCRRITVIVRNKYTNAAYEVTDVPAATLDQTNGNCCIVAAFCGRGRKINKTFTGSLTATDK